MNKKINFKNENGITMIALMTTVILMLIIASIAVYSGKETIRSANLEKLKTNMLLIKAKTRGILENVNHSIGLKPGTMNETQWNEYKDNKKDEVYGEYLLEKATSDQVQNTNIDYNKCYYISKESLEKMGLNKISVAEGEAYFVEFNEEDLTVEIYNNKGFDNKYSLTDIEELDE